MTQFRRRSDPLGGQSPRRIRLMAFRRSRQVTALMLAVLLLSSQSVLAASPAPRDVPAAQQNLAERFGGEAEDYALVSERVIVAGATPMWAAKFLDARTGEPRLVYRTGTGRIGGPEIRRAAIERAQAGLSAVERKASDELRARAGAAVGDELLPVAVWMGVDTSDAVAAVIVAHPEGDWIGDRPNNKDVMVQRDLRRLLDSARSSVYQAAATEIEQAIKPDGGRVGYVSLLAPLVYIDTPARSLDRLAGLDRVRSMGLEGNAWDESLASAGPEVSADWHTGDLDQGTGVRVGVIEYYNVRETGDLAGKVVAFHSESGSTTYTPSGSFDHPTWVAGAIASQDATDKGIAPGAVIVSSATGGGARGLTRDRNVIRAADWAATTGDADIINMSINMDSTTGRDEARAYFDSIAGGETFRTVIASSGNYGTGADEPEWWVSSPGTGWNVLTVGGMNDATNELWYDGTCPCSGALYDENPNWTFNPHGDFNKPDVSAPAVSVRTANGLSATGTSVATPIVSGIAAQLFARDATFVAWPEAMRAIVMAGSPRRVPLPGGGTSTDHEGVGTVNALWAHRIFVQGTYGGWAKGTMTASDTITQTFSVEAGQRVRVVLTWDSHTSGTMFDKTNTLTADLDLSVSYPGGSASSLSWDNASEFVSFTAPTTGTVTISIRKPRFDRASEYWALAWLKR